MATNELPETCPYEYDRVQDDGEYFISNYNLQRIIANREQYLYASRIAAVAELRRRELVALRAERDSYKAWKDAYEPILWMAERYAEGGGMRGPEMREYNEAVAAAEAAAAAIAKEAEHFEPRQVMPRVGGSSHAFRCHCGCNVFTEYAPLRYRCNACGQEYEGERDEDAIAKEAEHGR